MEGSGQNFQALFAKYLAGNGTREEMHIFWQMVSDNPALLQEPLDTWWEKTAEPEVLRTTEEWNLLQAQIYERAASWEMNERAGKVVGMRRWKWVAASVLVILSASIFWMVSRKNEPSIELVQSKVETINPGRTGALLQLADGRTISLDSLNDGQVAEEGGAKVIYADGNISYQSSGTTSGKELLNTMSTPKGRQFQLQLPDGSRAWLNAASSITYPVAFNSKERKIKVKGEVFLEVQPDSRRPFLVDIDGQGFAEVLGTSFNINAYADEPGIRTTLVDGLLRVRAALPNGKAQVIKPGQQVTQENNQLTISNNVNLSNVLAWKNGLFNIEGVSVEELLRQVARWYDLTIIYRNSPPTRVFHGELGRNLQLAEILEVLKEAEIKYSQNGRTLVIE